MPPMDRNERARQESQHALARGAFQRAWDEGRVRLLDRFGNKVVVDQYVLFHPRQDLIFKVQAVGPSPDPRVTAGVVQVVLETTVPLLYSIQEQAQDLCIVGKQTAPGHNELTGPMAPADADPLRSALEAIVTADETSTLAGAVAIAKAALEATAAKAATPPDGEQGQSDELRKGNGDDGEGRTDG